MRTRIFSVCLLIQETAPPKKARGTRALALQYQVEEYMYRSLLVRTCVYGLGFILTAVHDMYEKQYRRSLPGTI